METLTKKEETIFFEIHVRRVIKYYIITFRCKIDCWSHDDDKYIS